MIYESSDDPTDFYDEPRPRKRSSRCQCASDGEMGGVCPGPENCSGPGGYLNDDEGSEEQ
jgi:hypothetical protein